MSDCHWRLIVTYPDHIGTLQRLSETPPPFLYVLPERISRDPRIYFLPYRGSTSRNFGGLLRNVAFPFVETEWVGFLDDDDLLTPDYIDQLRNEAASFPSADAVAFRMSRRVKGSWLLLIPWGPREELQDITFGRFGISFAVRRKVLKPVGIHEFVPGDGEDFKLLADLHQCNSSIVVSNKITYLVRGEALTPEEVETWIGASTSFALPGLDTCDRDSVIQPYKAPWMGFTFPESDDLVYYSYIAGLKQSLKRIIFSGCVDADFFNRIEIDLHFNINTKPTSSHVLLIQVLLDKKYSIPQYSPEHLLKLTHANQVWVTSLSDYRFLRDEMGLSNALYVPAWNFVDMEYGAVPTSDKHIWQKFLCSRPGAEYWAPTTSDSQHSRETFTKCQIVPSSFCKNTIDNLPECVRPSVLYYDFYNSVADTPQYEHLQMVNMLQEKVEGFGFFRKLYGLALDMVIKTASIVVLPHRYDTAHLNYLLARGKVVVALRSEWSGEIETMYENHVVFVKSIGAMAVMINDLMQDKKTLQIQSVSNKDFIKRQIVYPEYLCSALTDLKFKALRSGEVTISTKRSKKHRRAINGVHMNYTDLIRKGLS